MIRKFLLAVVLAGTAVFLWGAVSWMVLPWHKKTVLSFQDQEKVAQMIRLTTPRGGVYALLDSNGKQNLSVFSVIQFNPADPRSPRLFLGSLCIEMLGALLLAGILGAFPGLTFGGKIRLAALAGLFAAATTRLPDWNWWGFPTDYTLMAVADQVIGATIAGMVIAWVTKNESV